MLETRALTSSLCYSPELFHKKLFGLEHASGGLRTYACFTDVEFHSEQCSGILMAAVTVLPGELIPLALGIWW